MRILFVSDLRGYQWGGSEELWSLAALRMAAAGNHVSALVHQRVTSVARLEKLSAAGCRVDYYHRWPEKPPSLPARIGWRLVRFFSKPPAISLAKSLQSSQPDLVVHSLPHYTFGVADMEMCLNGCVPYIIIVQLAGLNGMETDELAERLRKVYVGARLCCFVSEGTRLEVEKVLGLRLPNARVVRNPFNVPYDASPDWPRQDDGLRLACVGRLDLYAKGQDVLFEVLARPAWRGRRVSVSLVGKGFSEKILMRLAEMYGITDRVHFRGFTSDIVNIWAQHHALILPSRAEGLPLAVVEAMLCGRICIVTNVAGNAELVEDNLTGFVASAPAPDLLDEAMERAWSRRAEWRDMGNAAAATVRKFVPPDPVAEFVDLIQSSTAYPAANVSKVQLTEQYSNG